MLSFLRKRALARDNWGRILREAVEYSVVDHCNLRCAGCDHASPHLSGRLASPESFAADLSALSQHLHVQVLRLLGGEPLLHPMLHEFASIARKAAIADQIALWTNGLLLHKVSLEVLECFDLIRVSLYPNVTIRADLAGLNRQLKVNGRTRLEVVKVTRFQHQLLYAPICDRHLVRRTYRRCRDAHKLSCHTIRDGRYYKCAKAPVLEPRLATSSGAIPNREHDGVALHRNPRLADELSHYLLSDEPLEACAWCLGTDGTSFSHHQLDEARIRTERSTDAIDGAVHFAGPVRRFLRDVRDGFSAF